MTNLIKQRLLGMLIVVIAGVVFIPDLLDGKKQSTKNDFKKIPEKPAFEQQPNLAEFPTKDVESQLAQTAQDDETPVDAAFDPSVNNPEELVAVKKQTMTDSELEEFAAIKSAKAPKEDLVETRKTGIDLESNKSKGGDATDVKVKETSEPVSSFKKPMYILQLGSFKHKENVVALREKLSKAGIKTFIKPVQTQAGILSKVYIGPEADRVTLQKTQKKLKELTRLEGKITVFDPIN